MKTSKRRGFTIVELVIVIAVIAILAGVLIPTFSSIVKKANEASDTTLIKSLNTSLKAAEAIDGAKPATMHDALEATKADGYDVSKIKATASGNQILWDSVNNCFAYLKDGAITYIPESNTTTVEKHQLWSIAQVGETLSTTYSNYLAEGYTATELEVTTGIDVGSNAIASIKYTGGSTAKSVVIRTNGGALTINAEHDTVRHFGGASIVTVTAIAGESYHEHGTVNEIKLGKGRVVVENKGNVGSVLITSSNINDVKVKVESGSSVGGVGATDSSVAGALKTKVEGLNEEKVMTSTPSTKFAGGLGTEDAPYLIETVAQFKSIENGSLTSKKHYNAIADLTFVDEDIDNWSIIPTQVKNISLDGQGHKLSYKVKEAAYLFRHVAHSTFLNIDIVDDDMFTLTAENSTFINVDTYGTIVWDGGNHGILSAYADGDFVARDCDNYAEISSNGDESSYNAIFVGYPRTTNQTLTFENCNNYGKLTTGKASMFLANPSQPGKKLVITNCNNYGEIRSTLSDGKYVSNCFISQCSDDKKMLFASITIDGQTVSIDSQFSTGFVQGSGDSIVLTKNTDGTLTFTKSKHLNVKSYVVSIGLYATWIENGVVQGTNRFFATQTIAATDAETYTSTIQNLTFVDKEWIAANVGGTEGKLEENATYTLAGKTYYVVTGEGFSLEGKEESATLISVSTYDKDGMLISSVAI